MASRGRIPAMRCCLASFLVLTLLAAATPVRAQKIGTVTFPNSGAAAAQKSFLQGIALLHSYEYSDARDAFREARRIDPGFALAAWAEGMTFSHFDWGSEDLPGAQAALARLVPRSKCSSRETAARSIARVLSQPRWRRTPWRIRRTSKRRRLRRAVRCTSSATRPLPNRRRAPNARSRWRNAWSRCAPN